MSCQEQKEKVSGTEIIKYRAEQVMFLTPIFLNTIIDISGNLYFLLLTYGTY